MILIDSNIFMYAAGTPHAHKQPSIAFLQEVAGGELDAGIDAEVLQEILHRYTAIRRREDGLRVYDLARRVAPVVWAITMKVTDHSRELLARYDWLSARDALHAAVVICQGLNAICSYDCDFDRVRGMKRVVPGTRAGKRG